jgi:hypothetical protein
MGARCICSPSSISVIRPPTTPHTENSPYPAHVPINVIGALGRYPCQGSQFVCKPKQRPTTCLDEQSAQSCIARNIVGKKCVHSVHHQVLSVHALPVGEVRQLAAFRCAVIGEEQEGAHHPFAVMGRDDKISHLVLTYITFQQGTTLVVLETGRSLVNKSVRIACTEPDGKEVRSSKRLRACCCA